MFAATEKLVYLFFPELLSPSTSLAQETAPQNLK
jgi:hypothetical protein